MDTYFTVFEVIDFRSFSNLWYWIVLAVFWSSLSHWVLGVPYDMITRARRHGGQAQEDLEDLVRIKVNRMLFIGQMSGIWLVAFSCFVLTGLAIGGFYYRVEFCQALFFLIFPMSIVGLMAMSTAQLLQQESASGELLHKRLIRHRLWTQILGMISIFLTSFWGMYQNMNASILNG